MDDNDQHQYAIAVVMKYKERLYPGNDLKKIFRALQKLNEVDMTIDILQKTEVGKAVNKLKKLDGIGSFAKEIVLKWKKLLQVPVKPAIDYNNSVNAGAEKEEYDPTQNWEMNKKKKKAMKREERSDEYDPSQNWKMKMNNSSEQSKVENTVSRSSVPSTKSKPKKQKVKRKSPSLSPDLNETFSSSSNQYYHQKDDAVRDSPQMGEELEDHDSDDDYPSSREGSPTENYLPSVDSCTLSSVTSETVSFKNNAHDNHEFYGQISSQPQNSNAEKNHKTSSKSNKARLKFRFPVEKVEDKKAKTEKSSVKKEKNVKSMALATEKLKDSKQSTLKRKSDVAESSQPTKKSKTVENRTNNSKSAKPKRQKSSDLSFEQFMMMDTSKVVKKKKKPKQIRKTSPKSEGLSAIRPKVELHLPQIKSTYHPLPALPPPSQGRHQQSANPSQMTDELAAALHTQRNSKRMQVYSGQKRNFLPKMMSLYDQCMNVLSNNIDMLDVIGVPYDIIKPVLERCTVEQLYRLEDSNPYLLEDTGELWKRHAQQDFRNQEPNEMESWREMYLRLYDAREEKLLRLTHSIQAKVNKAKPLEKRTKLAYVGVGQAKAPRNVLRAQLKYGTAGKKPIPYAPSSSNSKQSASSSASNIKQQVAEIRMSVPIGTITASTVDDMASNSRNINKKQAPRIAPMMAKTLKSINKLRYKR